MVVAVVVVGNDDQVDEKYRVDEEVLVLRMVNNKE